MRGAAPSQVTLVVEDSVLSGNVRVPQGSYQIRYAGNGLHAHDDELEDFSAVAIDREIAWLHEERRGLDAIDGPFATLQATIHEINADTQKLSPSAARSLTWPATPRSQPSR